jgi:hypothetical protein
MARSRPTQGLNGPVRVETDRMVELQNAIEMLSGIEILIGIPSDSDQPHFSEGGQRVQGGGTEQRRDTGEGGIQSNATLGYIHEHGSPAANIPARPWLGPGVEESRAQWTNYMRQAGEEALSLTENSQGRMERGLHAAGMTAVSAVKVRIVAGLKPDLSPRTIAARRARTPSRQAATQADVTPLVDTGQLLNSISYVIKRE